MPVEFMLAPAIRSSPGILNTVKKKKSHRNRLSADPQVARIRV